MEPQTTWAVAAAIPNTGRLVRQDPVSRRHWAKVFDAPGGFNRFNSIDTLDEDLRADGSLNN